MESSMSGRRSCESITMAESAFIIETIDRQIVIPHISDSSPSIR